MLIQGKATYHYSCPSHLSCSGYYSCSTMGDSDILDLLFDQGGDLFCGETVNKKEADMAAFDFNSLPADLMIADMGSYKADDSKFDFGKNWNSSFLNHTDTEEMLFNSLLNSNLPDDAKQHQTKVLRHSDHAYSTMVASSPTSDSGFSNDPSSPSSYNSVDDVRPISLEDELFGPLNLKEYDVDSSLIGSDPMFIDNFSDSDDSTPDLHGNESPVSFEFEEVPQKSGKIIINSTLRPTKLIKVVSVNKSKPTSPPLQSLLFNRNSKAAAIDSTGLSNSPFQELRLSDEEKELLRREGINLPTHLPLTREEEKLLRSIKRRIRNKASARNSRRKKQDYMEALEQRVKLCTEEKRQLEKKVGQLEKQNGSLVGQLRKLQKLVTEGTRHSARTGTCAMILALSFALVLLPSCRSLLGNNTDSSELENAPQGRTSRTLLQSNDISASAADCTMEPSFFDFVPFLRKSSLGPLEPPCGLVDATTKVLIDEEVDGLKKTDYATTGVKRRAVGPFIEDYDVNPNVKEVIHMEITKLPDDCHGDVCVNDEPPSKKPKEAN